MTRDTLIAVVDDDESVRDALPGLLRALGFVALDYGSASAFLDSPDLDRVSCILLDIAMPDMSGPELLRELRRRGHDVPVVFITALEDAMIRARILEEGAVECLFKPFSQAALLTALNRALQHE
ncbi:MAG TPA: response regulator [Gemmatimonadales bacterium]|nr:response regulator [Gemmatimonadales bacterium]